MHRAKGFHHWKRFLSFILLVFILSSLYTILEVLSNRNPQDSYAALFELFPQNSNGYTQSENRQNYLGNGTQPSPGNAELAEAFAVPCDTQLVTQYPIRVISFNPGSKDNQNTLEPAHSTPEAALYTPEDTYGDVYVSLGFGGEIILEIEPEIRPYARQWIGVVETSPGVVLCDDNPEKIHIQVSSSTSVEGAVWSDPVEICQTDLTPLENDQIIHLIKIVDISNPDDFPAGEGGYDLDGVIFLGCTVGETLPTFTDTSIPPSPILPPNTNTPGPILTDTPLSQPSATQAPQETTIVVTATPIPDTPEAETQPTDPPEQPPENQPESPSAGDDTTSNYLPVLVDGEPPLSPPEGQPEDESQLLETRGVTLHPRVGQKELPAWMIILTQAVLIELFAGIILAMLSTGIQNIIDIIHAPRSSRGHSSESDTSEDMSPENVEDEPNDTQQFPARSDIPEGTAYEVNHPQSDPAGLETLEGAPNEANHPQPNPIDPPPTSTTSLNRPVNT